MIVNDLVVNSDDELPSITTWLQLPTEGTIRASVSLPIAVSQLLQIIVHRNCQDINCEHCYLNKTPRVMYDPAPEWGAESPQAKCPSFRSPGTLQYLREQYAILAPEDAAERFL